MDKGTLWATVHGVAELDTTKLTKQQDFGLLCEEAQILVCSASEECNEIRSEKGVAMSFPRSFI